MLFSSLEFSQSEFHGRVKRDITYLIVNTFPATVIESMFPLLPLCRFPLTLISLNKYIYLNLVIKNYLYYCTGNVSIVSHGISLVTMSLLDFVAIQWIQLKPFWENFIIFTFRKVCLISQIDSRFFCRSLFKNFFFVWVLLNWDYLNGSKC